MTPMASLSSSRSCHLRVAGFVAGFLVLVGLSALGTAGWARHGERLWLAMADGAWANCF